MKIGFLTSVPITIESFFLDWMRAWNENGWEVHAASGGPRPDDLIATSYTNIDGLTQDPSFTSIKALRSLAAWRKALDLDVVIVNTGTASALYRLLPRHGPKIVYFCHGLHFGDHLENVFDRGFWMVERALLGRTDAAIVMNSADGEFFTGTLDKSRVLMLEAGVGMNTEEWEPHPSRQSTDRQTAEYQTPEMQSTRQAENSGARLVWMGMFSERKRPHDAIRLLDALRHREDPSATLTMLGSGPLVDEVTKLVAKLGLDAFVTMPGQVDPRPFLADADVLIHTAEWEGYCRTLMEASFIGLPAVSYDVKGCRDVFGVEAVGDPGDIQGLVHAVRRVRSAGVALEGRPDFSWQAAFESTNTFLVETLAVR